MIDDLVLSKSFSIVRRKELEIFFFFDNLLKSVLTALILHSHSLRPSLPKLWHHPHILLPRVGLGCLPFLYEVVQTLVGLVHLYHFTISSPHFVEWLTSPYIQEKTPWRQEFKSKYMMIKWVNGHINGVREWIIIQPTFLTL
jgi:hypothetical protein